MKYTVLGFQQQKLIENDLTVEDALLLRTITDMYSSDRMDSIIKDEKRYIWINQTYLLEQIPILGSISKLKRMLNKLCDDGLLENVLITNKKGTAGRFYYIKYTEKLDNLEDYDIKVQNDTRPNVKMALNQSSKWHNKDTSIIDSSIKDNKEYTVQIDALWKLYPNKKGKKKAFNKLPKLLKALGYETLEKCINRYIEYVEERRKTDFPDLKYQNGDTFFNGTYEDYLDENYQLETILEEMKIYRRKENLIKKT